MAFSRTIALVFASAATGSLALINKPHGELPSVKDVLKNPTDLIKDMDSQLQTLGSRIETAKNEGIELIKTEKSQYEADLAAQMSENTHQTASNKALSQELNQLNLKNKDMRKEADAIADENANLQADLQSVMSNITLAQEFSQTTLDNAEERMHHPDISVLSELDEQDAETNAKYSYEMKMRDISALQISAQRREYGNTVVDAGELVASMAKALDDLAIQQNASQATLKAKFDTMMHKLLATHDVTMAEQAKLTTARDNAKDLNTKLATALIHLKDTREKLVSRSGAIRTFAQRLGARPIPNSQAIDAKVAPQAPVALAANGQKHRNKKHQDGAVGLSLLQTEVIKTTASAQALKAELPPVWKVAMKPHELVEKMGSRVASLELRLKSVSKQHTTDVQVKKAEYEHTLEKQAKENHAIEHSIHHLTASVTELKSDNAVLRSEAKELMDANNGLRNHLTKLMANMTTAHEFTETSLGDAKGKLHNATEISVLKELDSKDAETMTDKANSRRLDEVEEAGIVSLLELGSSSVLQYHKKIDAMELLAKMNATLTDLVKEQNASMLSLRQNFDNMFEKAQTRMTELLEHESDLNNTKANETVLQERLDSAVKHLNKVHTQLQSQVDSVRGFLAGLGTNKGKQAHAQSVALRKASERAKEAKSVAQEAYDNRVNKKVTKHVTKEPVLSKKVAAKAAKAVSLKKDLAHHKAPTHTSTHTTRSSHSSKSHKTSTHHSAHKAADSEHAHAKRHSKASLVQQDKPTSKHEAAKKADKKAKAPKKEKKEKKESIEDQMDDMIGEGQDEIVATDDAEAEEKSDDAEDSEAGHWWSPLAKMVR